MDVDHTLKAWSEERAQQEFRVNSPPAEGCRACGLYATCKSPGIMFGKDPRTHINGKDPRQFPLVMVVGPRPSPEEDEAGEALKAGFAAEMLSDYLSILEARWVYVPVLRCATTKSLKKNLDACKPLLASAIANHDPQVIVALGKDAFESLWPEDQGKPPSLFKARTMPIKLESGRWLLGGYDPASHKHYLETDGVRGQDLGREYPMTFSLVDRLLNGDYKPSKMVWDRIQTQDELDDLVSRWNKNGVTHLCIDMEDDTFCGHSNGWRPYKVEEPGIPGKYTRWHPDNRLLNFGVCALEGQDGGENLLRNYAINVDLLRGHPGDVNQNAHRLLFGKTLIGWNIKVEVQDVWLFTGYDMVDPANMNTLVDGMIMRALRDQSLIHNGLKPTAQELFGTEDWSHKIWQELNDAKKDNPWGTSSMGDCNPLTREEYNIGDVYWNMRLVLEKLPHTDYSRVAYENLVDGIPFIVQLEREGLPFQADVAHAILGVYEREISRAKAGLFQTPEFQRACQDVGLSPEDWSPKKKKWWESFVTIFGLKNQVGTTPTGMLRQDASTVREFAGEGDDAGVGFVAWPEKTYTQKVFTLMHRLTRYRDDANKYRYYLDYVVPAFPGADVGTQGRIHPDYYMVKAETEDLGNNTDTISTGGAKSGRFSRTPPQNANNDPIFLKPYTEIPGWLIVEVDYSQAELVWIAHNCQDELLSQWIREGADLHLRKGAVLFSYRTGRPESEFWKIRSEADCKAMDAIHPDQRSWRQLGKTDNFAFAFLQEPETIARTLGISLEEAYAIGQASDRMHPNILARKIDTYERLNRGEMVYSSLYQRKRSCPLWSPSRMSGEDFFSYDPDIRKRRHGLNISLFKSLWNTVIAQADSSDMAFHMGKRLWRLIQQGLLDKNQCRPMDFVHDAVRFRVRESYLETAAPVLAREMKALNGNLPIPFDLPIQVSVKYGRSLAKTEKFHL
jgi:uracil-DNA glycosylase